MAVDITYITKHGEVLPPLRALRLSPDETIEFGQTRIHNATATFVVAAIRLSKPVAGDEIWIGTERFLVQGEPSRDPRRTRWFLDTRPAA